MHRDILGLEEELCTQQSIHHVQLMCGAVKAHSYCCRPPKVMKKARRCMAGGGGLSDCFSRDQVCTVHACAVSGRHAQARAVAHAANMARCALPTCSTARYNADTAATMLSASPLMPRTARYRGGNSPRSVAACSAAYSDCQPLPHCRYLITNWHESYQPSVGLTSSQHRGRSSTHVARALST
jgi:hypothetical protein